MVPKIGIVEAVRFAVVRPGTLSAAHVRHLADEIPRTVRELDGGRATVIITSTSPGRDRSFSVS